ncbi:MAG: PDZ domain-containing protein [Planctomycetes bacterium]|nr:PDZ domain-containing protein [Planctomycetota bacterium]
MNPFIAPLFVLAVACTPNNQDRSGQGQAAAPQEAKSDKVSSTYKTTNGTPKSKSTTGHLTGATVGTGSNDSKTHTIVLSADGKNAVTTDADGKKRIRVHKSGAAGGDDQVIEVDGEDLHEELFEMADNGEFGDEIKVMVAQGMANGGLNNLGALRAGQFWTGNALGPVEYDENAAFFGVGAEPVSAETAAQLPLKPGTGLVVTMVVKDSPAEKAGLQKMDVLSRIGDQMLINTAQLSVLIRANKPGDSIGVTYLRGGKEQTVMVPLVSKKLPKLGPGGQRADAGFNGDVMMIAPDAEGEGARARMVNSLYDAKVAQGHAALAEAQAEQAHMASEQAHMAAERAMVARQRDFERGAAARAAKAPKARNNSMSTTSSSNNSNRVSEMRYNDDAAEIVWSERDGKTHVKVVDHASGSTVYDADGAPDAKAREGFSEEVRASVESFMEDQAKMRSTNSTNPFSAPPMPPAPPNQAAPPAPPSTATDSDEIFEMAEPTN